MELKKIIFLLSKTLKEVIKINDSYLERHFLFYSKTLEPLIVILIGYLISSILN